MNLDAVLNLARNIMIATVVAVVAATCMATATAYASAGGRHGFDVAQAAPQSTAAHGPRKKEW